MQATEFVKSYLEAWNHHDPRGVADHLADGGIYRDIPENAQHSADELVADLYEFFSHYRHHYELIGDVLSSGDTVAFQYRMVPPDDHASANRTIYQGAEFISLQDDSAVLITDYYDVPEQFKRDNMTPSHAVTRNKYAKSGLSGDQLLEYKRELDAVMSQQAVYMRSGLTLPQLAQIVGCSVNHLSQVINAGFGMSFFDYVNRYRIEYAKQLLNGLEDQGAVLKVAFTVGFNSNSAFYAAFKKHVGMTPAQYRRSKIA